ncbi:MAG: DUF1934 domain-containing protein [Clostridia bacterium]|nr:DUF1934 domain-containing protein [Clostridia bacterium]
MKYTLEIIQSADGDKSVVAVDAEGALEDGVLSLEYCFDGAHYALKISERAMEQTRTGDINLQMVFFAGERTECRVSDGQNGGSFLIYTEEYSARFEGGVCTADCAFSDGAGGESTRISVTARRAE